VNPQPISTALYTLPLTCCRHISYVNLTGDYLRNTGRAASTQVIHSIFLGLQKNEKVLQ
jgi:hypothetical protein